MAESMLRNMFCSIFDIDKKDKRHEISDEVLVRRGIKPESEEAKRFRAQVDAYHNIGKLANKPRRDSRPTTFQTDFEELSVSDESWRKNAR